MTVKPKEMVKAKCVYDEALDEAGFGSYTCTMLLSCCLLILAMYMDMYGFSVVMPAVACDLGLDTSEQALLSAIPLIGVMLSSYTWGFCADTWGRRSTLLGAMTVGAILNIVASFAPNFASLAVLKFCSAGFTASANAAGFVLLGETTPQRYRNQFMFLMASATMMFQMLMGGIAVPVFTLSFHIEIPWLLLDFRPWRLLWLILSAFGILGVIILLSLKESPKFLLSKGQDDEALEVLSFMYCKNTGQDKKTYRVSTAYLEEPPQAATTSFIRQMWNGIAPLFRPPLRNNNLILYFMLLSAYMTSTGYTMWIPTMTNAFFDGEDTTGKTFCAVASTAATSSNSTSTDCDNAIQRNALYATMVYSGASGTLNILLSFIVDPLGRKKTTIMVFTISAIAGIALLFVRIPMLSIGLFFVYLYAALILANVNSYLVELNPTYLRGMATCLSVVVARGFGFMSVQVIAVLLADYCTPMIGGYVSLVIVGGIVACFLPPDKKKEDPKPPATVANVAVEPTT